MSDDAPAGRDADPIDAQDNPHYCAYCDRDAEGGGTLCDGCGERLVPQGYCPICERSWRLPVGASCPKHEIGLEPKPPRAAFSATDGPATQWVTVETFGDALKAEAPRIRLEAEGIPTFVEGARMGSHSMYPVATGGVRLQVPQPLAADARVLLSQSWAPVVTADDDLDDVWEELAPDPGAVRRQVMKVAILVSLFGPALLVLLARLLGI